MSISANKGEHSELLAFLRILHEGRVQLADKFGEPRQAWLKVSGVKRPNEKDRRFLIVGDNVLVVDNSGTVLVRAARGTVGALADKLFFQINKGEGPSFVCSAGDEAILLLKLGSAKAGSAAKADLIVDVMSPVYEGEVLSLGFSVKSELGGLPTLLNAGATRFEYRIESCSADEVLAVQEAIPRKAGKNYPGPMRLLPALKGANARVVFDSIADPAFEQNLKMIDTSFPEVLAGALMHAYIDGRLDIKEAVRAPALLDDLSRALSLPLPMVERFVRHKMKDLLRQSALGMNPGRQWDGQIEAHGGWIIVKEGGLIVCFHLMNDDEFRDYLLNNTKFDTPSMARHEAGYAYKQKADSMARLRLSLQVRFK